jgi:phosphoenolpyruvate carboxylase
MLSQSTSRVGVDATVLERLKAYRRRFPTAARAVPKRHREMPYRCLALLMAARLKATAQGKARGYPGPDAFLDDLDAIAKSLAAHKGERAGLHLVRRLQWRARTFGFHLATLDVRQHAAVHRDAIGVLLGDDAWLSKPLDERLRCIRAALAAPPPCGDPRVASTLEVFRVLAWARGRFGAAALGPYIVSMAESAEDVLGVLLLARVAGCVDAHGHVPLDVSPLFETVDDLDAAPRVLDELLRDRAYRAHLDARGGEQVVMLGYSDSSKDGSLVASRFALQRAQEQMVAVAQALATRLTFFHGRGGTVSRGGTKTERAIEAAPDGAIAGRLRLTEQGEVIHRKYGLRAVALRTIEQAASALLLRHLAPRRPDTREGLWAAAMARIALASRAAYRALVYEEPQFNAYFRAATPIDVIERMPIGSRPSSRAGEQGIARLRAIPWVFAWSQCRCTLPGWYGLGSGLEAGIAALGLDGMREMAREWPFFETLLEDAEMVLAKSDLGIAAGYSRLAGALDARFFPRIRAEFDRTCNTVLAVRGTERALQFDPRLARSLRLRNPYVDPLSLLQIDLLQRWRAAGRREGPLFRALVQTVTGISRGLQNTG